VGSVSGFAGEPPSVILTLQRHLLPAALPILPQVRLAACYLAGMEDRAAGDGWFDAFALPGGMVALMAGNARSHGPEVVAATSELRAALREALIGGISLLAAVQRAESFAARFPAMRGATLCLGLLDPATGALRYVSAGQLAPIACALSGTASFLPPAGGRPLGVGAEPAAIAATVLAPDSVLLLCSGGTAGGRYDSAQGRESLVAAVAGALADDRGPAGPADRMCRAVAGRLASVLAGGDVTVVAAHRLRERLPGWSMQFPAEPVALRQLRGRIRAWLSELGAAQRDRVDTELAVYEAAANAVIHGRPARGAAVVRVQVSLDGVGGALIEVSDRGRWKPGGSPDAGRERSGGRGLTLISKVTDELSIVPSQTGTTILLRRPLSRPVTLGRAPRRLPAG
jgi:anti-sigma regulatory factor (Ser/Thr protein kinase)